jgi:hypothetical protein
MITADKRPSPSLVILATALYNHLDRAVAPPSQGGLPPEKLGLMADMCGVSPEKNLCMSIACGSALESSC